MEHFKIFFQSQGGCRQLLLVRFDVFGQLSRRVDELKPFTALQPCQQPLMVLGVLPYPGVAVVDIDSCNILVGKARKDNKPFGQEVSLEAVAGSHMCQINHYLVGLSVVGFEGEKDMVDEQVSIYLACFEPKKREMRFRPGEKIPKIVV